MSENPPLVYRQVSSVTTDANGIRQLHLECGHTVAHGNERAGDPLRWAACGRCRWGDSPADPDPGAMAYYESVRARQSAAYAALREAEQAGASREELRRLEKLAVRAGDCGD